MVTLGIMTSYVQYSVLYIYIYTYPYMLIP